MGQDNGQSVRAAAAGRERLAIVGLLKASHAEAGCAWPFRAAYAERVVFAHMADPEACCLVIGDRPIGVLMARAYEQEWGAGKWAKETLWFIAPEHRGGPAAMRMLDAYEAWARERGCTVIGMASLAGRDVSALYRRRGYAPAETHFVKAL